MEIIGVIPQQEINFQTKEKDLMKAMSRFRENYPDADIVSIDDRDVIAMCESCDLPIFDGEEYYHDEDGVRWHKGCP